MPFSVRWKQTLIEGVVDLAFVEDEGVVVVDFKTDRIEGGVPSAAQLAAYRPQAVVYAFGVERTTGLPVREMWLSFLRSGTEARVRGDWEAEVETLIAAAR